MTPLEAARKMLEMGPYDDGAGGEYYCRCIYCDAVPDSGRGQEPHQPDCPYLALPQIVAALEIVSEVIRGDALDLVWGRGDDAHTQIPARDVDRIRAALKGEPA